MIKRNKIIIFLVAFIIISLSYIGYRLIRNYKYDQYLTTANSYMSQEKYQYAIEYYDKALRCNSNLLVKNDMILAHKLYKSKTEYEKGQQQINCKNYAKAIEALKNVCKEDKKRYTNANEEIVQCYCYENQFDKAEGYITGLKKLLSPKELKPILSTFYIKKADDVFKTDQTSAVAIYQKAAQYGYNLSKSDNYKKAIFSLASSIFNEEYSWGKNIATYVTLMEKNFIIT